MGYKERLKDRKKKTKILKFLKVRQYSRMQSRGGAERPPPVVRRATRGSSRRWPLRKQQLRAISQQNTVAARLMQSLADIN